MTTEERKKALEEQIAKLKAKKQRIEALENKKARKEDTRAKIIIGGHFLSIARRGPDEAKKLIASLEKAELRESDKETLKKIIDDLKSISFPSKEAKAPTQADLISEKK